MHELSHPETLRTSRTLIPCEPRSRESCSVADAAVIAELETPQASKQESVRVQDGRRSMSREVGCVAIFYAAILLLHGSRPVAANRERQNHSVPTSFATNYRALADARHFRSLDNGTRAELVLDQTAAAGFASRFSYLYGRIGLRMKLVAGDSAGTVTAFYLRSDAALFDEMDFEFLGNVSGQPYILQTNVFTAGRGEREQRIFLWFDPTAAFHEYAVLWNKHQVVFSVDGAPVRVFRNLRRELGAGVGFPAAPMRVYSSIWNGENWATSDGWVKLNWSAAPFVVAYEGFHVDACLALRGIATPCAASRGDWWARPPLRALGPRAAARLAWVKRELLVYNYCDDRGRFAVAPPECAWNVL